MIDLSIIIVNYNVKEFLESLLHSVAKALTDITAEVIVVDNASSDGSIEMLQQKFPDVKLISNNKNVGFGAANNQAMEVAKGRYFALVNPDVLVSEKAFTTMINFLESREDIGIAGCKVLNPDGTLQLSCRRSFPSIWTSFSKIMGLSRLFPKSRLFAKYNLTYLDENKEYEVDAISGAFMVFRKECYDKIGGFDQVFFMYGEDLDLCYRVQQAGYKVYYYPRTRIVHYKGESTRRSNIDDLRVFYNAMDLFVRKHLATSLFLRMFLSLSIKARELIEFVRINKKVFLLILLDFCISVVLLVVAEFIYLGRLNKSFPVEVKPWIYFIPGGFQIIISFLLNVYDRNKLSITRLIRALFLGGVLISTFVFFFNQFAFSRGVLILFYLLLLFFLPVIRFFIKAATNKSLINYNHMNNTLIVGIGENSKLVAKKLISNFNRLDNVVGFVSEKMIDVGKNINDIKVIGSIENISKLIKPFKVNRIIFSSVDINSSQMFDTITACSKENVEYFVTGKDIEYMIGKSAIAGLDNIPLVKIDYNINSFSNRVIKTSMDAVISLLLMVVFYIPIKVVYMFSKSRSDFIKFILALPKVIIRERSLIGPRKSETYGSPNQIKSGLVGLWFTEAERNKSEEAEKKLNIYYAKNQNIWLDLDILRKSFMIMKK